MVLEEVCKKQGFLPVDDYELKHGRNTVDPTLSFRFANLPNNAKLELVKAAETRAASQVTIALQLENGQRLTADFPPVTTLKEMLNYWDEAPDSSSRSALGRVSGDIHPVCIYMTEEIVGLDALASRSLRQLGLTKGRAIIRLFHRKVEASVLDEIRQNINKERTKQEKLEAKAQQHQKAETPSSFSNHRAGSPPHTRHVSDMEVDDQSVTSVPSRCARLDTIPVQPPDDNSQQLSYEQQQLVQNLSAAIIPQIRRSNPELGSRSRDSDAMSSGGYVPFKFPEATKGKELYKNEMQEDDGSDYRPCERHALVYTLDEPTLDSTQESDLPDDFFEVTQADVTKLMKDLKEKAKAAEDAPLMTSSMRQAVLEEQMNKYDHVVIRVQFPDRLVLQGLFKPRETVHSLEKFVKEHLANKSEKFYLYTTPPKTVLKDKSQTLILAHLAPAAVVHIGIEEKREGAYLSSALLQEISSRYQADSIVSSRVIHNVPSADDMTSHPVTSSPSDDHISKRARSDGIHGNNPSTSKTASTTSDGKKVPKWFTAGKK